MGVIGIRSGVRHGLVTATCVATRPKRQQRLPEGNRWSEVEPPSGFEPETYALRVSVTKCHGASYSIVTAGQSRFQCAAMRRDAARTATVIATARPPLSRRRPAASAGHPYARAARPTPAPPSQDRRGPDRLRAHERGPACGPASRSSGPCRAARRCVRTHPTGDLAPGWVGSWCVEAPPVRRSLLSLACSCEESSHASCASTRFLDTL